LRGFLSKKANLAVAFLDLFRDTMLRLVPPHEPSGEGPQNALLIVSPTRCASALQAELPTNVTLHGKWLTNLRPRSSSFRFVSLRQTAQYSEDETLRFAKRNERIRDEGRNT
jgi:hypothetical protein